MRKNKIGFILLILCVCFFRAAAQEVLTGVVTQKPIMQAAKQATKAPTTLQTIQLPFVDDFSNYTGYPNPSLWADRQAFVNRTFALRPPTLGVATLDALDENGVVYAHASAENFYADSLTSNPIRLDYNFALNRPMRLADSLYLSFYYQPGGGSLSGLEWERRGNRPDPGDSLILEFGYATGNTYFAGYSYCEYVLSQGESYLVGDTLQNPYIDGLIYIFETSMYEGMSVMLPCDSIMRPEFVWRTVWSTPGISLDEWLAEDEKCFFKQVMIPIKDQEWLIDNFQFRFRNIASLEANGVVGWAGNVDYWHIDYVRLDVNRSYDDIYPDDIAFSEPTTTILKDYYAMPWSQFTPSELRPKFANVLVNLSNTVKTSDYTYYITDEFGRQIGAYNTSSENIYPYHQWGFCTAQEHVEPPLQAEALVYNGADSATYTITHVFKEAGAGDIRRCNDTCTFVQHFDNYYAYDDGSAEAGYSLISMMTHPETYFAMRFTLTHPDTLRAVQMWFNAVQNDANFDYFTLMVWDDAGGRPGNLLYEEEQLLPQHEDLYTDFVTYYLKDTLPLSGTFYVGFFQSHNVQLNLGFDQNSDGRSHFMYKTAAEWQDPFLLGTPMVRAVMGTPWSDPAAIPDYTDQQLHIYPNPATDYLVVDFAHLPMQTYRIFDACGKMVYQSAVHSSPTTLSVANLKHGIYFLQMADGQGKTITKKIIIH